MYRTRRHHLAHSPKAGLLSGGLVHFQLEARIKDGCILKESAMTRTLHPQGVGRGSPREGEAVVVKPTSRQQPRSKDAVPGDTPSDKASRTTHYPERPDFALVSFEQDYQSNNLSDRTPKRQFWSRENGRWKIIHETSL